MGSGLLTRLREIVFGVQDGLISNVALTTSMAIATGNLSAIIIAGITGAVAGTFSMASGAFLSSRAEMEVGALMSSGSSEKMNPWSDPILDALAMGISFLVAALIPIVPYFLLRIDKAIWMSVCLTLVSLFLLGLGKGFLVKRSAIFSACEVLVVGMMSASIGYILGEVIPVVLGNMVS